MSVADSVAGGSPVEVLSAGSVAGVVGVVGGVLVGSATSAGVAVPVGAPTMTTGGGRDAIASLSVSVAASAGYATGSGAPDSPLPQPATTIRARMSADQMIS
jgi:hypothetical protein